MIWIILGCFFPALVISWFITGKMRVIAPQIGLIDQPAARKVHSTPTPLGGGLGILAGFMIPVLTVLFTVVLLPVGLLQSWMPAGITINLSGVKERLPEVAAMLMGCVILSVMGLLDDFKPLSWKSRLLVQALITMGVIASGIKVTIFVAAPWVGMVFTFLWIMMLINSFNFLDNMDALSSGIGLIAACLFALIMLRLTSEPRFLVGGGLLMLAGSLTGFLYHNYPPAKIFMGDSGSTVIGFLLGCFTVLGTFYDQKNVDTHVILAPLCILAIPIYDITTVMAIRIKRGLSPFQPDKNHFSHRLVALGLSRKHAVLTIHLATLTTGMGGLILYRVPNWPSASMVMILITCVLSIVGILEYAGRKKAEAILLAQSTSTNPISVEAPKVPSEVVPSAGHAGNPGDSA